MNKNILLGLFVIFMFMQNEKCHSFSPVFTTEEMGVIKLYNEAASQFLLIYKSTKPSNFIETKSKHLDLLFQNSKDNCLYGVHFLLFDKNVTSTNYKALVNYIDYICEDLLTSIKINSFNSDESSAIFNIIGKDRDNKELYCQIEIREINRGFIFAMLTMNPHNFEAVQLEHSNLHPASRYNLGE